MYRILIGILSLTLFNSCSKTTKPEFALNEINEKFISDANLLFGSDLTDLTSYSSYSANSVDYVTNERNFNYNNFIVDKSNKLSELGWFYYMKVNEAYIFCDGINQLEIVPPSKNVTTNVGGDHLRQLKDEWNIQFYKPNHTSNYACYNFKLP